MSTKSAALSLTGTTLSLEDVERVALDHVAVEISSQARAQIAASRSVVDSAGSRDMATYGLNTGVGRFVDKRIPEGMTAELQRRVLRSHAAGVGDTYPSSVVRAAHLLRINTLALGYSGVRPELVELMVKMLNRGVLPHVPARGSVGASGDLAPLSHLCLPLIGEGRASFGDDLMSGADAMSAAGLAPIELASKEGLSLINGTQFMTAQGIMYGQRAQRLAKLADIICALSVEALRGTQDSFLPQIHRLRPHPGQRDAAANMHLAMEGSSILESHRYCDRVQDAYALRCAPQVHGATRDALTYARTALATEAVSVTDNPLVFADEDLLRSNGNFHGQPVAIPLDVMAIAVAELANISERRIERLVNPSLSGLPAFLAPDGGLNSGYMIAQYTAASLVSENKVLSHPASVDSIPTSAAQEDHVSMGNHAGIKLGQVIANAERVLTIEALCAAQGVDFLHPRKPGRGAQALYELVRERVPYLDDDRVVSYEIEELAEYLSSRAMLADLESALGAPLN